MPLSVTESHAVNELLDWIMSGRSATTGERIPDDTAREAASILAASAYKALSAGADRRDVDQRWPKRRFRSDVQGRQPLPRGART